MTPMEEEAFRKAIRKCRATNPSTAIALIVAAPSADFAQRAQIDEDLFAVLSFPGGMGILVPETWATEDSGDHDLIEAILRHEMGSGSLN